MPLQKLVWKGRQRVKQEKPQKKNASKIPRLEDANKASPPTSARTGGTKIPLSARSSTSIKSVGSNWSDDSECFPSAREPKNQKPNLVALQQQRAQDPGGANQGGQKPDEVLWSDEESLPIDSSRDEKPKQTAADAGSAAGDKKEEAPPLPSSPPPPPPPVKADNLSDFDSDDEVEDQVGSPMASSTKKALEIAGISEKRQEEIMAELGMSDVSSVSDLSDDDIPNLAQKYSLNTSRVLSPVAEDSERSMSHRTKRTTGGKTAGTPRSAKKGKEEDNDSDWDDTTAASDFNTPRGPLKPQLSARSVQSNMSNWDSDEDEPVKEAPVKAQAAIQNNSQPGPQSSVVEATEHATAAMNTVTPVPEAVVATSAVTTSAKAPPSGGATKPTVKGGMDFQESEEEEEEESEWEKERREKQQKWEAEYQQKQEQMRLDAQKELQKEKEQQKQFQKAEEYPAQGDDTRKKLAAEKVAAENQEWQITESLQKEQQKLGAQRKEAELREKELAAQLERDKAIAERREQELTAKLEWEKAQAEQKGQELAARLRQEKEETTTRLNQEKSDAERRERELTIKLEQEKAQAEQREHELAARLKKEQLEDIARFEREKLEAERKQKELVARLEQEKAEVEKKEQELAARLKQEQEATTARLEQERSEAARREKELSAQLELEKRKAEHHGQEATAKLIQQNAELEQKQKEMAEQLEEERHMSLRQKREVVQQLEREKEEALLKVEQQKVEAEKKLKEARELLEQERREMETRLQREAEEREKKEKEHQAQLEEIKRQQAEAQKKRDQLNRTAEDEEKSRQIELRRDKAEKQLAEARARQAAGFNHTLDLEDDEDDTYNGVDIPYSPRDMEKTGETAGLNTTQDDDGLSYSSTEAEDPPNVAVLLATSPPNFSMTNDSSSLIRLQEQLRETKRILERERSSRVTLENKRKNLETEKAELLQRLEDMSRLKSQLEQNKIDIEAKIRSCEYQLNEETEKRKNMEILYNKTKEQLNRKEEQYTEEIESKQRIELQMRNVQMELKSALSAVKQLEEEKEDLQRQMQHEKNQRQLQEQINEETLRLQQALADDSSKTAASQAEAMSRLEEVDETRKQAIDSVDKLKTELYAAKMELERQRARYKEDHTLLASENEDLQSKIEELKSDIKLNEEALAHATVQYNIQLSTMKTENAVLASTLEKERQGYEKIQTEIDSLKNRLESANAEMEKAHNARSEMERNSYKEREEWTKVLERRDQELNTLKESNQNMSHKLGAAEGKVAAIENELHIANATLMERSNQLSTIQRELDQRKTAHDLAEEALRKIKEENVRFEARQEAMTDRVSSLQNETTELRRQLEDERRRAQSPTKSSSQDKLSQMLNTMQHENNKTRTSLEEKNSLLNESLTRMREELRVVDARKSSLEQELRHLGLELSDTHRKLTVAEASLELANKTKEQLEGERLGMKGELERVQTKLDLAQEKQLESQQHIAELTDRLEKAEQGVVATSQQLATQSATTEAVSRSKTEAEGAMHKLEVENAKLSASLAHENDKVSMLQRDLNESNKERAALFAKVNDLHHSNAQLELRAHEATAAKTAASHDAEESQNLWDLEVKARSKLGLKISQLEKAKQEAQALYDEEKKKLRKALELKKAAELKLEAEIEKNQELQKEIANLKAYLKAAKRRLKLDDVQGQLETEIQDKDRLQSQTAQLKQQINTHKQADRTMSKLQRTNQKLEQELKHYRSNYLDQSEIGRIRAELEARSRMELNQKLEEVNAYLEEQAQAREKLDSLRSENENELRREFERTKRELLDELSKIKSSYKDSMSSSTSRDAELQRYKDMYENEVRLRGKLAEKLQQATEKALTAKLTQSFQHSLPMSNGFPSQNGWVGSSTPLGRSNHGHGESLGNKLKAELDRSIAKHLEKAPQLEISSPPRASEDPYGSSAFNKSSSEYLNVLKRNYLL